MRIRIHTDPLRNITRQSNPVQASATNFLIQVDRLQHSPGARRPSSRIQLSLRCLVSRGSYRTTSDSVRLVRLSLAGLDLLESYGMGHLSP
jgi:hypothetical protein